MAAMRLPLLVLCTLLALYTQPRFKLMLNGLDDITMPKQRHMMKLSQWKEPESCLIVCVSLLVMNETIEVGEMKGRCRPLSQDVLQFPLCFHWNNGLPALSTSTRTTSAPLFT